MLTKREENKLTDKESEKKKNGLTERRERENPY